MVLKEIVGRRYDPSSHIITFTSRTLPTAQANDNRVFQQLDAVLFESRTIAKKMNEDNFYAQEPTTKAGAINAQHDRLFTPPPALRSTLARAYQYRRNFRFMNHASRLRADGKIDAYSRALKTLSTLSSNPIPSPKKAPKVPADRAAKRFKPVSYVATFIPLNDISKLKFKGWIKYNPKDKKGKGKRKATKATTQ
jgi:hypothetical protein